MTVTNTTNISTYTGNGSAATFDFNFLIDAETQLTVLRTADDGTQTTLTLNTDYSINETGNESGSYITFPLESSSYGLLQSDENISIFPNLAFTQETAYKNSSALNLENIENSFDYQCRLAQQLKVETDRAVKVPYGSSITADELLEAYQDAAAEITSGFASIDAVDAKVDNLKVYNASDSKYGAKGNANYLNPDTNVWYEDALFKIPATDDTVALCDCFEDCYNAGGGKILMPKRYAISSLPMPINHRPIQLIGRGGGTDAEHAVSILAKYDPEDSTPLVDVSVYSVPNTWRSYFKYLMLHGNDVCEALHIRGAAWFKLEGVDFLHCLTGLNSIGSLTYKLENCFFNYHQSGIIIDKHPTLEVYGNAITLSKVIMSHCTSFAVDVNNSSGLSFVDCDIEGNGTRGDINTGAIMIRNHIANEGGFPIISFDRTWLESNKGNTIATEAGGSASGLLLSIKNSLILHDDDAGQAIVNESQIFSFDMENTIITKGSAGGAVNSTVNAKKSYIKNSKISNLADNSTYKTHINVLTATLNTEVAAAGYTSDIYISDAKSLFLNWASGVGSHQIHPDAITGELLFDTHNNTSGKFSGSLKVDGTDAKLCSCAGSPEGVKTAPVGSVCMRTDGAAGSTLYVKETGTSNTGWKLKNSCYNIIMGCLSTNPNDASTYYFGLTSINMGIGATTRMIRIPRTGVITKIYGDFMQTGTLGTTETSSLSIRKNNTTDYLITDTLKNNATTNNFSNNTLSIPVTEGDYILFKWETPTWETNPTSIFVAASVFIEC